MNTAISLQRESNISIEVLLVTYLSQYYSHVLERQVSIKQTLCLTLAQVAFVVMVITFSISVIAAAFGVSMFAGSLLLCKKVL